MREIDAEAAGRKPLVMARPGREKGEQHKMRENYLYPHTMFEMNAGCYYGVFMPEDVMKKMVKLQVLYMNQVRTLLNDNSDKLLVSSWTMATEKDTDGKITSSVYVKYSEPVPSYWDSVESRIEIFKPEQPKKVDVYLCDRDTANLIAKEILEEKMEADKRSSKGD